MTQTIRGCAVACAVWCCAALALSGGPFGAAAATTNDLAQAAKQGLVEVRISGLGASSGDSILADVANKTDKPVRLTIPAGTVLQPSSGGYQSMVVHRIKGRLADEGKYTPSDAIALAPRERQAFVISAYCLDLEGENPSRETTFDFAALNAKAKAVLDAAARERLSIAATQAAMWMKLGDVSPERIGGRIPISDADLSAASSLTLAPAAPKATASGATSPPSGTSASADTVGEGRPTERVSPAPECNPNAVVWRTPQPPQNPQAGDIWVNPKDGMEMVFVPAGEFMLGTSDAEIDAWLRQYRNDRREYFKDQQPQCRVRLGGFWIGRTEVTNAQYLRFVQATKHRAPEYWSNGKVPAGLEDFPVVELEWSHASAYSEWAGGRLPTEMEWEKAARGTDGRAFPWGNKWESKQCRNFVLVTGRSYPTDNEWLSAGFEFIESHDELREGPVAVASYPGDASPYGCLDMAGNEWEWCRDWYDEKAYERYARGDLAPPPSGSERVLRGGSWSFGDPRPFRCAYRSQLPPTFDTGVFPVNRHHYNSFRYVRDAGP